MKIIAEQPYYKIIRQLSSVKQQDIKEERKIILYSDKLTTKHREFPLEDVFDMSFRQFGKEGGLLYLHTNNGVYSYKVDTSPKPFISSFKEQVGK